MENSDLAHLLAFTDTTEPQKKSRREVLSALVRTDKALMESDLAPVEWLVPKLLPNPGLVAFAGRPGSFKTFFALGIARQLAAGLRIFPRVAEHANTEMNLPPSAPINTLFVEEEMSERQMKSRGSVLKGYGSETLFHLISAGISLKNPEDVDYLVDCIKEHNIKLLILDPFSSIAGFKDENSNSEASEIMDTIRHRFVHNPELSVTVLFIHHPSKDVRGSDFNLRGAGDILGKCDMVFGLQKNDEKGGVNVTYIKNRDLPDHQAEPFRIELEDVPPEPSVFLQAPTQTNQKQWALRELLNPFEGAKVLNSLREQIITLMESAVLGTQKQEIAEALDKKKDDGSFKRAWATLKAEGRIVNSGGKFYLDTLVPGKDV